MKIDELYALLRRRGVLWPSAEPYGGAQGLYDYGPIGAALKRRLEEAWCAWFLGLSDDYYRIEPAEILPEAVVRASGHLENFTDPEVRCTSCGNVFRADTLLESLRPDGIDGLTPEEIGRILAESGRTCPSCGKRTLSVPKPFNLMFGLDFGVTAGERAYLAPETAQASYLAFPRMWDVGRRALPLGIAVISRAFRNEIAPRQVLFRMRAFTQAELQIFFDPAGFPLPFDSVREEELPVLRATRRARGEEAPERIRAATLAGEGLPEFYVFHLVQMFRFLRDVLGYPKERIRFFEKSESERAFYNRIQFDAEVHLESLGGFREVGAIHYRGDYDLTRHGEATKKEFAVQTVDGRRIVPHVLEITFGIDRNLWALADVHLRRDGERTVWGLPAYLAPVQAGVFPLLKKEHSTLARTIADGLARAGVDASFDDGGAIGRRYARLDEVGTPFCVTVDGESVAADGPNAGTVTLRRRDSREQRRVAPSELALLVAPELRPPRPPPP